MRVLLRGYVTRSYAISLFGLSHSSSGSLSPSGLFINARDSLLYSALLDLVSYTRIIHSLARYPDLDLED